MFNSCRIGNVTININVSKWTDTVIILPTLLLSLLLWISILTSCFKLYHWFYFLHPLKLKKWKTSSRPPTVTDKCVSHLQRVRECMLGNFIAVKKFVIQSVTGGIREYMECLKKFRIGTRLMPRPIQNLFRHSIYSRILLVTDCITNVYVL